MVLLLVLLLVLFLVLFLDGITVDVGGDGVGGVGVDDFVDVDVTDVGVRMLLVLLFGCVLICVIGVVGFVLGWCYC